MSSELRELYQEVILDHSKRPRNFRELPAATGRAEGYNPLCGDRATVYVELEGDRVKDVSFKGAGCSISTASASMMTEALKGKTRAEADALFDRFHRRPRAGQAGRLLGRVRVPRAREMRVAAVAHPALGPGRRGRPGLHRGDRGQPRRRRRQDAAGGVVMRPEGSS